MKRNIVIALLILACASILYALTGDETVSHVFVHKPRLHNTVWDDVITAVFDDDDTGDVTQAVKVNGIIQKVILQAPNGTNAVTYQVQILDNEDVIIFDSGEQAENADYSWSLHEPVTGTIDVVIGPSGAIGATNPDVVVTLRGI